MKRISLILAIAFLVTSFAWTATGDTATTPSTELLGLINAYRATKKLSPLEINTVLTKLATDHSKDMASHKKLNHNSTNGDTFAKRMEKSGLKSTYSVENIAMTSSATYAKQMFELWKKSPPHNANMLNNKINSAGFGFSKSKDGYWYGTFDGAAIKKVPVRKIGSFKDELCTFSRKPHYVTYKNQTGKNTKFTVKTSYKNGSGWLNPNIKSFTLPPGGTQSIGCIVLSGDLKSGTYNGSVQIEWSDGIDEYAYEMTIKPSKIQLDCNVPQSISNLKGTRFTVKVTVKNLGECPSKIKLMASSTVKGLSYSIKNPEITCFPNATGNSEIVVTLTQTLEGDKPFDFIASIEFASERMSVKKTITPKMAIG